jgi:hypothetical protein
MGNIEALFADTVHESMDEAIREAQARKNCSEPVLVSIDPSPYGGWRVRSIPAEIAIDLMIETGGLAGIGLSSSPRGYE